MPEGFRRGPGFRPPWWPENEPFPPAGRPGWGWRRGHFARRVVFAVTLFFALIFLTSSLAVALVSGTLGLGHHRGLAVVAGLVGLALLFAGMIGAAKVVRRTAVPLSDVMEAADRVASGDHAVRVEERGSREMRRLARSFNAMTEHLRASEEQRRNLLADLAHELRTPLSVIQGNAEGMLDGLYPPDRDHLEPLLEEIRVMSRLLDDLQTLSTAEAGVLRLYRQSVEPDQLVEDAAAVYRPQAEAADVTLEVRAAERLPPVDVDPVRIGEVLANLLSNALRATPRGGSVTVSAEPAEGGRRVAFTVEDTGDGIPDAVLPHVFERFVKSARSGGAGLGLAIAKSLVEAHGGEITATSHPGKGTRMRFVVPSTTR
jgi:two-component system OmpR family sensor kinase/two-component system sensor histidine kinase BaeS